MWKDDYNLCQRLFCGHTRKEIEEKGWSHPSLIKALTSLSTMITLLIGVIGLFIFHELIWANIWLALIIIWIVSMLQCKREIRSILIFITWSFHFLIWFQYHNTAAQYHDHWFGSSFVSPCNKSACTKEFAKPNVNVPYHPKGYFSLAIPTIDHLLLQCPVYDCNWAPPEIFSQVKIQAYFNDGTDLPDYSRPCNSSMASCDFFPSNLPNDYSHLGVGVNNKDTRQLDVCNNDNNHPVCSETSYPRDGRHVISRCSAYFAHHGKIHPKEIEECGVLEDYACLVCPGGTSYRAPTRDEIATMAIFQFVLFIFMSIILIIVLFNIVFKFLQEQDIFCQRRDLPPFYIPENVKKIENSKGKNRFSKDNTE